MVTPRFSIIIPTLNEEEFLPRLLESLSNQSVKNFEVIVVDGKSKDKTVERAHAFDTKLPKLTVVTSKKASLPLQRNLGAKQAKAEWFAFIDADSVLLPNFFERVGEEVEATAPKLLSTWFRPDTNESGDALITLVGNLMVESSLYLKRPMAPGPLTLVRRDVYEAVGGYDETHAYHEDVDLGIRLHAQGVDLHILRETLYVLSLRRLRKQGALKVVQQYIISALPVLVFGKPMKYMPGYIMGGAAYAKKHIELSTLRKFQVQVKKLVKELLD